MEDKHSSKTDDSEELIDNLASNEQKKRKRQLEKQISAQKKRNQASSSSIIVNLSPNRAAIREQCVEDMTKQANSMEKLAQKANGIFDGNLTIGTNVLLAKPHIDASRMDTANLSMVIVGIDVKDGTEKYRLATEKGVLKILMGRDSIVPMKGQIFSQDFNNVVQNWKTMNVMTQTQLCNAHSLSGGQGLTMRCRCTGKCDNNKCKCFKNGWACSNHCHPHNTSCCSNSVFTRFGSAVGLSILLIATIIGTPAALACLIDSMV